MITTSLAGGATAGGMAPRRRALAGLFGRVLAWWQERRRIARTIAELEELSDAELADIGISRADIERVARRTVRFEA